ncbi:major facilitator superfamily domain-containing protein [Mycena floridula]|nr:major facilitator superfamily domain-containing protein [Mycena floridula]
MNFKVFQLVWPAIMAFTVMAAPASDAADAAIVTFCTGPGLSGDCISTFTDLSDLNGFCHNFTTDFQDAISSAQTSSVARCTFFIRIPSQNRQVFNDMKFAFSKLLAAAIVLATTVSAVPQGGPIVGFLTLCTEPNLDGTCEQINLFPQVVGACHNFDSAFRNDISSAETAVVTQCSLFTGLDCSEEETFITDSTTVNLGVEAFPIFRTTKISPSISSDASATQTSFMDPEKSASQPQELSQLRKSFILFVLSGALFFDVYSSCAAITLLPVLGKDLVFQKARYNGRYLVASRIFFIQSLCSYSDFSSLVGLLAIPIAASVNPIMTIVLRAVQGIGAAMNAPTAIAMVSITFQDPQEQGQAYAVYSAVGSVKNVAGYILGGVITARLSRRWVFYLLAIVVVPFSIASWFILPVHTGTKSKDEWQRIDWLGIFSLTIGLILFVFAVTEGGGSRESFKFNHIRSSGELNFTMGKSASDHSPGPLDHNVCHIPAHRANYQGSSASPGYMVQQNFIPLFVYALSVLWYTVGIQVQAVKVFVDLWGESVLSASIRCLPMGISGGVAA